MAMDKRSKTMLNLDFLPEEILEEIFQRMPSKNVIQLRCLSPTWNAQLSSSRFLDSHVARRPNPERLILLSRPGGFLHMLVPPTNNDDVWNPTPVKHLGGNWFKLFASFNGLLLMLHKKKKACNLFLVNPLRQPAVLIPKPPSVLRGDAVIISYGLGYDSVSDDYKIVTLSHDKYDRSDTCIEVYAMKTRVWRTIASPFPDDIVYCNRIIPCVNGALHWYTSTDYDRWPRTETCYRIVSFDLANESFGQVPFPEGFRRDEFEGLDVVRGCLGCIVPHKYGGADIWVMNEYGVQDSWVNFTIPENSMWSPVAPLRLIGDEKVLCTAGDKMQRWTLFDFNEGKWNFSVGGRNPVHFVDGMVFEESLVSLE